MGTDPKKQSKRKSRQTANMYTIVMEYEGGAYYSQFMSTTEYDAAIQFIETFDFKEQLKMKRVNVPEIIKYQIDGVTPFPIIGAKNVWFFGFILKRKLAYCTIVKTAKT